MVLIVFTVFQSISHAEPEKPCLSTECFDFFASTGFGLEDGHVFPDISRPNRY